MKKKLPERDNGKTVVPLSIQRLLKKQQAAAYCGVSIPTFAAVCPVPPIALGIGKRLERYDIRDLDDWIEGLKSSGSDVRKDWLSLLR
jgi:hypothetical protein